MREKETEHRLSHDVGYRYELPYLGKDLTSSCHQAKVIVVRFEAFW